MWDNRAPSAAGPDTREPFSSQILPRYQRASEAIRALLSALYPQGLATGDFEPALRTLLGDAAPLSPASIVRLKEQWAQDYTAWKDRSLADHQYAYLWADGLYLKAGPETEHIAVLIVIGVREDGHKELLAMVEGYRESAERWRDVLRDLVRRGVGEVTLIIGDGALGLWAGVRDIYPAAHTGDSTKCRLRARGYIWCFNSSGRRKRGGDFSMRRTSSCGSKMESAL